MPPRSRPPCVICHCQPSKYACAVCRVDYCSVACYKTHKGSSTNKTRSVRSDCVTSEKCPPGAAGTAGTTTPVTTMPLAEAPPDLNPETDPEPEPLQDPPTLRTLTSLKWPYVPDTSAYPDPLTRDDPKPLQLHQYEAIATSPAIRGLLANSRLRELLSTIDTLRSAEREEALQRALRVDNRLLKNTAQDNVGARPSMDEDTRAFRAFAEAVEGAVRGGKEDTLGLAWD